MNLQNNSLSKCLALLSVRDRLILLVGIFIQFILSLFDLVAIFLLGIIGTLSVRGIQNSPNGGRIETVLSLLRIEDIEPRMQIALLAGVSIVLFVCKTVVSAVLGKRLIYFLSRRGALISITLFRSLLYDLGKRALDESRQSRIYAVGAGVSALFGGVLVQLLTIVTDMILLIVLLAGVFIVSPIMAISILAIFGLVALILNLKMSKKSFEVGSLWSSLYQDSNNHLDESISLFRENFTRGTLDRSIKKYERQKLKIAELEAERRFLPFISKYVIELVMLVGIFLVSATQFAQNSASTAVGQLSIFLAATMRVAPAVLRIQQAYISMKGNLGTATPTLEFITEVQSKSEKHNVKLVESFGRNITYNKDILIKADEVYFKYPSGATWILNNFSLQIYEGDFVAITGESGVGKSTLVDLLLGIEKPEKGEVIISGRSPEEFIRANPGYISYVPQRTWLIYGTVRDNLLLGSTHKTIEEEWIMECLRISELEEFMQNSKYGLETQVGPAGSNLSGGQIQRIGIARALVGKPKLLVLDEATNALDPETEMRVISNIHRESRGMTIISIAHRDSILQTASLRLHISTGGKVVESRVTKWA